MPVLYGRPPILWRWIKLSSLCFFLSLLLLVLKGPSLALFISLAGAVVSAIALVQTFRSPETHPSAIYSVIPGVLNAGVLFVGLLLRFLLLTPLSPTLFPAPPLDIEYKDPSGHFQVKLPSSWELSYESTKSGLVTLTPQGMDSFFGALTMQLRFQRVDTGKRGAQAWMARMVSADKAARKGGMAQLTTENQVLSTGEPALWSSMTVQLWWIPIQQDTLFVMKNKVVLCSLSITGLSAHAGKFRSVAVQILESLKVNSEKF